MRDAAAATLRRLPRISFSVPPKFRRRAIALLLLALALVALYRFWFRDSSFVRVQHVSVTGLTTKDAPRIRMALTSAARDMSTMDVSQAELNRVVSSFPVVKEVVAQSSFPHTLKIHVIEETPAAVLDVGGQRLLLAPDGSVLRDVTTGHPLALIKSRAPVPQDMLTDRIAMSALHAAAAVPADLAGRVTTVTHGKKGILVHLRDGPLLIFGSDSRPLAKWKSAAAVLADPSSRGATYIDVRLPGRPIAGGLSSETLIPLSSTGADSSAGDSATGVAQNPQPSGGP